MNIVVKELENGNQCFNIWFTLQTPANRRESNLSGA